MFGGATIVTPVDTWARAAVSLGGIQELDVLDMGLVRVRRSASRGSPGQAVVEAALAFLFLAVLFVGAVSLGQLINYNIALENAAATGATAAAQQANMKGGDPSTGAVKAVNREQGVSDWSACGGSIAPPCVSTAPVIHSTSATTSVTVEQVTLHGSFQPLFSILGVTLPVTVSAAAST